MPQPKDIETAKQLFADYLSNNKLRKTPERYAILSAVYTINAPFDVERLYLEMEQQHFRVSHATIYNTIQLLIDAKLLVKHLLKNKDLYEAAFHLKTKHYLVCTECGSVREMTDKLVQTNIENSKMGRFQMSHYSLYIYGECSRCRYAKNRKRSNKNKQK
ncbi:MAG: transcriptional repressor [Bacteroidaceae bacterium]|nr:transcriptional repressor [Bacteroidaceae bacterium]